MVVISAAVCTKAGRVLVARQFQEITRLRMEGLLSAFPKLLMSSDKSHTYIETDSVRYLYQALEQLFVVLVTNKASNIIDDLETLQTIYKVTTESCSHCDEDEICRKAFDLMFAYDEAIAAGYREKVTMPQISQYLEMDSQEEKLHEMIERNKRREAEEEAKRRQHRIDMDRQERRMYQSYDHGEPGSGGGGYGGPQVVPSYQPQKSEVRQASPPKAQRKGMVLAPKGKKNDFLDALESEIKSTTASPAPAAAAAAASHAAPQASVQQRDVHLTVEEKVVVQQRADGDVKLEVKGDLSIVVNNPQSARVAVFLKKPTANFQYKTHPNIDRNKFTNEGVLILKAPDRPFPTGAPLGLLKYRFVSQSDTDAPLSVTFWPTPNGDGTTTCNIECELHQPHLFLECVEIYIPIPSSAAPNVLQVEGQFQFDDGSSSLVWQIPSLSGNKQSASMEFVVKYDGDNAAFYPIQVAFMSSTVYSNMSVTRVSFADNPQSSVPFSVEPRLEVESFQITA